VRVFADHQRQTGADKTLASVRRGLRTRRVHATRSQKDRVRGRRAQTVEGRWVVRREKGLRFMRFSPRYCLTLVSAVELAMIMDRLYGGVCYAGIDTDPELKYPKGAGRVAFSNQQSYIAAISARFVQLQHGDIDKRVSIRYTFCNITSCIYPFYYNARGQPWFMNVSKVRKTANSKDSYPDTRH